MPLKRITLLIDRFAAWDRRVNASVITRRLALLGWGLFWIITLAFMVEYGYRIKYGLPPRNLPYPRYSEPYLEFGEFQRDIYAGEPIEELPEDYGYQSMEGTYLYSFNQTLNSIADRGNFLFRYQRGWANEVEGQDAIRIFVIGSSVALGGGATTADGRWWVVLGNLVAEKTGQEVQIILAALPSYNSTQERLALELMVFPRCPDAVIILDGYMDLAGPMLYGIRPGDTYIQRTRYESSYQPLYGVNAWLLNHSTFYRVHYGRNHAHLLTDLRNQVWDDPQRLENYVNSTSSIYLDNIAEMLTSCRAHNVPCAAFLQPARPVSYQRVGIETTSVIDQITIAAYTQTLSQYELLADTIPLYDLTALFDEVIAEETVYDDEVHFNDVGQDLLARAIYAYIFDIIAEIEPGSPDACTLSIR